MIETLEGEPEKGYIIPMHPDRLKLEKGWVYYNEYSLVSGNWEDIIANIRDYIWEVLKNFVDKDGNPACEIRWIGKDDENKRVYVQFKVKNDIADVKTHGLRPEFTIIPGNIALTIAINAIVDFLFGKNFNFNTIYSGLVFLRDMAVALGLIGTGIFLFIFAQGIYKIALPPIPIIAGFYVIAKHFGVIK